MTQLLDQRLRLLQVFRVKPFAEPVVDGRQRVARFLSFALLPPQASEACRGAEFPRFGLLLAGNVDGFEEAGFGFRLRLCPRIPVKGGE